MTKAGGVWAKCLGLLLVAAVLLRVAGWRGVTIEEEI